jgi:hypothetical protein
MRYSKVNYYYYPLDNLVSLVYCKQLLVVTVFIFGTILDLVCFLDLFFGSGGFGFLVQ